MSELWAKRKEPHAVGAIIGKACHGCRHMSCIPQPRSLLRAFRYYCETMHKHLKVDDMPTECERRY